MSIDDLKLQIKDTPISRVVEHYIPLTRRGNQTLAICPFHQDTKPSLNVNDSKGMFMCFACNTGGDHITFVEKYRNLSFMDSLREITEIIGLDFSDYQTEKKKNPDLEMAQKILNKAIQIYQKHAVGNKVFDDFVKDRKLKPETVKNFKLGHAPGNNILSNYLLSIKDEKIRHHAIQVGLKLKIIHPDKMNQGKYFDTFRDRIMFPIFDSYNHPMGFTSRATRPNQNPKYLNSSESLCFIKKKLLYGVNLAKSSIREKDEIILCEGNMDVITLHQKGFDNAVAIMGTAYNAALTPIIKSLSKKVVFALDSDQAGHEATKRINQFFLKEGITGRHISFHPQKDPDEFLNENNAIDLETRIKESIPFIDTELKRIRTENPVETIDQKIELIKSAFDLLSPLGKSMQAKERIAHFAQSIGVKTNIDDLFSEFAQSENRRQITTNLKQKVEPKPQQVHISTQNPVESGSFLSKSTQLAIREILNNPEVMELEKWGEVLDLLSPNEVKMWFASIQRLYFEVDDNDFNSMVLDILNEGDTSPEFKSIVGATVYRSSKKKMALDEKGQNQLLNDLIKRMKKEQLIEKRKVLFKQHAEATLEQQETILREINNVQMEIKNINE